MKEVLNPSKDEKTNPNFPFLTHVNLQIIAPKITIKMIEKQANLCWKSINKKSLSYQAMDQQQNQTLAHINSPTPHMQAHPITMNQMWALHMQKEKEYQKQEFTRIKQKTS